MSLLSPLCSLPMSRWNPIICYLVGRKRHCINLYNLWLCVKTIKRPTCFICLFWTSTLKFSGVFLIFLHCFISKIMMIHTRAYVCSHTHSNWMMFFFPYWMIQQLKFFSSWKVLPREYGLQYPWNFIFKKDFWRKKKIVNNCSSSFKVKIAGNSSEPERNLLGQDTANPAIEAISLDMKQQELDGRYIWYTLQVRQLSIIWYIVSFL